MEGIELRTSYVGLMENIALMRVKGCIDTITSPELENSINKVLVEGYFKIITDLENVDYISSAGWGIFVSKIKGIREEKGDLVIVGMKDQVFEVFELLEFNRILKFFTSVDEAIEKFDGSKVSSESRPTKSENPENGNRFTGIKQSLGIESEQKQIGLGDFSVFDQEYDKPLSNHNLSEPPPSVIRKRKIAEDVIEKPKRSGSIMTGSSFSKSLFEPTVSGKVSMFENQEFILSINSGVNSEVPSSSSQISSADDIAKLPLSEKVKLVVLENPAMGARQISKILNAQKFGYTKVSWIKVRRMLNVLKLSTRKQRFRFWRSR